MGGGEYSTYSPAYPTLAWVTRTLGTAARTSEST